MKDLEKEAEELIELFTPDVHQGGDHEDESVRIRMNAIDVAVKCVEREIENTRECLSIVLSERISNTTNCTTRRTEPKLMDKLSKQQQLLTILKAKL